MIGKIISHYKILEKLGEGGMGVVYRAHETKLDRTVALKFLPPHLTKSEEDKQRFIREAKAAAALNHPHICTIYSVEEYEEQQFISMEYIDGVTLRQRPEVGGQRSEVRSQRSETPATTIDYAIQIAEALAEAHEKGIVHRDIKPENIMVDAKDRIKVMDFGLAKLKGDMNLTKAGITVGTVAYMSPEQIQGQDVDHRSDIFSFGVVLYEMCTGQKPFRGEHEAATVYSIVNETHVSLTEYLHDISPALVHIIDRLLEKNPDDRYQSMNDVTAELRRQKRKSSTNTALHDPTKTVLSSQISLKTKRSMKIPVLTILSLFLIAGFLYLFYFKSSDEIVTSPDTSSRVAVMVFENLTGDPSLDPIGRMTSDWITQGLSQTGLVDIVPSTSIFSVTRGLEADGFSMASSSGIKSIGEATGASMVISGAYYRVGSEIQFQAQVTDIVSNRLLFATEPVSGLLESVTGTIENLRQNILGSFAIHFDEQLSRFAGVSHLPATYDAYRYYVEGVERFGDGDFTGAIAVLNRSTELDPDFIFAHVYKAYSYIRIFQMAVADSIITAIIDKRDELAPFEKTIIDYMRANIDGDRVRALQFARTSAAYAPNSEAVSVYVQECIYNKRPLDAINALLAIDPDSHFMATLRRSYINWLSQGYHLYGDHENELALAREGRQEYPDDMLMVLSELRALAALGRVDEVFSLLEEIPGMPPQDDVTQGVMITRVGLEFWAHGFQDTAREIFAHALDWFRSRPGEYESNFAFSLYFSGRVEESKDLFEMLIHDQPDNMSYNGMQGIIAAQSGDTDRAMEYISMLGKIDRPYLFGTHKLWQARIAAHLGDNRQAIMYLRDAFREGYRYHINFHSSNAMFLEPLLDDPEYRQLVAVQN
jgi:serine/threonine protein kinase